MQLKKIMLHLIMLQKDVPLAPKIITGKNYSWNHRGQNSKLINIAKYVSKLSIFGAKILDKCFKSQKKFLYIVLFCKVKLSKMVSIKTNKIKRQTALF